MTSLARSLLIVMSLAGAASADLALVDLEIVTPTENIDLGSAKLNRDPSVAKGGKLVLSIAIAPDGTVTAVGIEQAIHPRVDTCVRAQLLRLQFPAAGAVTKVTYPLLFSPGD